MAGAGRHASRSCRRGGVDGPPGAHHCRTDAARRVSDSARRKGQDVRASIHTGVRGPGSPRTVDRESVDRFCLRSFGRPGARGTSAFRRRRDLLSGPDAIGVVNTIESLHRIHTVGRLRHQGPGVPEASGRGRQARRIGRRPGTQAWQRPVCGARPRAGRGKGTRQVGRLADAGRGPAREAAGTRMHRLRRIAPAALLLGACARMAAPPGGPARLTPPVLVAVFPDSVKVLPGFRGAAEFRFDEVISEGSQPNFGYGNGDLEKLVMLSPDTAVPSVRWHRNRITVQPRNGWQPKTVYRIELVPGVTDLRQNRSKLSAIITFATGGEPPTRFDRRQ